MSQSVYLFKSIALLFFLLSFMANSQAQEPTIATCEGTQFFCLEQNMFELCVEITVDPDFTDPIDHFEIDWGDNSPITTLPASNNPVAPPHTYDFTDFFNTCVYDETYFVTLTTFIVDGNPVSNIIPLTFQNPPIALFSINPSTICAGNEACFNEGSCPTEALEIISWDYGDGTSGTDECHVYENVGNYTVVLTVANNCGTSSTSQNIQVIERPIADGIAVSGTLNGTEPYIVCLGNGIVELDGDSLSQFESTYTWSVQGSSSNYNWLVMPADNTPNIPDPTLQFVNPGSYLVFLSVDNACGEPDLDTLLFEVLDVLDEAPIPQEDACEILDYEPNPLSANLTYSLNGSVVSSFPLTLGPGTYTLEASDLTNPCFTTPIRDTFVVNTPQVADIFQADTTICSVDGGFSLSASPLAGDWEINGMPFNGTLDLSMANPGLNIITYGDPPCVDFDTLRINIQDVAINLDVDDEFCIDNPATLFSATPNFGVWSGDGIVDPMTGEYDPALAGVGPDTVYYMVVHPNDSTCTNEAFQPVEVSELFVDFMIDSCNNNTIFFDTLNTSSFDEIMWDFGDGGMSNNPSPSHEYSTAQDYLVSVNIERGACVADTSRIITIDTPPVAAFTLVYDPDACTPLSVQVIDNSTGSNLSYEWQINGSTVGPPPYTLEAIGEEVSYEITLIIRNDCATSTHSETIIVRPLPAALFGTNLNIYCSGDTILMSNNASAGATIYQWYKNNTLISTDSVPPLMSHLTDMEDTIEVCLIVGNDCGMDTLCRDIIFVPTDVFAFFNTSNPVICAGEEVCFENFSNVNAVIYDFGDGTNTTDQNPCHTYPNPGTYTVIMKAFGCGFDSVTATVVVEPIPLADFINPVQDCPGQSVVFNEIASGADGFVWDFGDGSSASTLSSPAHSYTNPGNYEVCLTVTSLNQCEDQICKTITIAPLPEITGMTLSSNCVDDMILFESLASADVVECLWDFGDNNVSNLCTPTHSYATAGNYTVRLIVSNGNGCMDTLEQAVPIDALPIPDFEVVLEQDCAPATATFINNSLLSDSFSWDFGDGATSTETNPTHVYTQGGTYTIVLMVTNGLCVQSLSQEITVYETPEPIASLSAMSGCSPFVIDFESLATGSDLEYEWDFGDGAVSFDENPSHTFMEPGEWTVRFIVSNPFCQDTSFWEVEIFEPIEASLVTTDILCAGEASGSIDLSISNGTPDYEFDWSNGAETEDLSNVPAGAYGVTITDSNDCEFVDNQTLVEPPPISVNILDEIVVSCFGGQDGGVEIEAEGGMPDYTYAWPNGSQGPSITNVEAGIYVVTITDGNACTATDSLDVFENTPILLGDSIVPISCYGFDDGQILLDLSGGGGQYEIAFIAFGDTVPGTRFDNLPPGDYAAIITDNEGCTKTFSTTLIEPFELTVEIAQDTTAIALKDQIYLPLEINQNDIESIIWYNGDTLFFLNPFEPLVAPERETAYLVTVINDAGCIAQDTITILVEDEPRIYIPNIFSPNNDGVNDFFTIYSSVSIVEVLSLDVFDRWGNQVFGRRNFPPNFNGAGWDGYLDGKAMNPGVFVYRTIVRYRDGSTQQFEGDVTLIR